MTTPSYDEVRQRVERRYSRLSWFIFHLIMAVTTVAVIWAIDPTPQDGTPVIAALWVGVLVCHAVKIYLDTLRDRAVERTWQRVSGKAVDEKPKRTLLLSNEAELEVIEEDAPRERVRRS